MPNGNPNFDRVALDRFFAPFATTIERFAALHNLAVIKYYHEAPSWALCFQHPISEFGFRKLSLYKTPENTLALAAAVWVDEYDSFTRRIRMLAGVSVPMDAEAITARMESMLDEVLSWPLDEQFAAHSDNEPSRGSISKAMWISGQPKWPKPVSGNSG
jgi:hypothetical protein